MWYTLSLLGLVFASLVAAHGRITKVTTSRGLSYPGWDPEYAESSSSGPPLAAWSASNLGNIYVTPSLFATPDIVCHYNAAPGILHVNITAGEQLTLQWNEWPTSHVGPVLTYLAACNGSCTSVNKNTLKWIKIDELGWLNSTGWDELMLGGTWATDVLIYNKFQWIINIPETLVEGHYVLRHEIIALHVAEAINGAQAYPQCVNIKVFKGKKKGTRRLYGGTPGASLYRDYDKGIFVDVHKKLSGYNIPGPRLWSGATPVKQPNQGR
ncbi:glycoside hydrolase [Pyrenochaeta sp. DS3sAY3a]|nr:glycoside hydrolase [Pyrenochaeta sp. DS3sAY3a]